MTFTSRNAAKGAAAFSLAMLLVLPALTGCSMDKPQADDMEPEATQSQNVAVDQAEPKAGVHQVQHEILHQEGRGQDRAQGVREGCRCTEERYQEINRLPARETAERTLHD